MLCSKSLNVKHSTMKVVLSILKAWTKCVHCLSSNHRDMRYVSEGCFDMQLLSPLVQKWLQLTALWGMQPDRGDWGGGELCWATSSSMMYHLYVSTHTICSNSLTHYIIYIYISKQCQDESRHSWCWIFLDPQLNNQLHVAAQRCKIKHFSQCVLDISWVGFNYSYLW